MERCAPWCLTRNQPARRCLPRTVECRLGKLGALSIKRETPEKNFLRLSVLVNKEVDAMSTFDQFHKRHVLLYLCPRGSRCAIHTFQNLRIERASGTKIRCIRNSGYIQDRPRSFFFCAC